MAYTNNGSTTTTFAFATIFLLVSLALVAVTFSTNHWQEIYVDREALVGLGVDPDAMNMPIFYTRFRGLFRTCYPKDASFLDTEPSLVEGVCLKETGYEIPTRDPDTIAYGSNYEIKIHLLRSQFAGMVLAMLFLFVACFTAVLGCWNTNARMMRSTGTLVFVGMFFGAAAMAVFHGIYYLEERILQNVPGTLANIQLMGRTDVDIARLEDKTTSTFGYSYILGWLSVGVAAISGILYLIVGYKFHEKHQQTYGSKSHRNRAYDYMDKHGYTLEHDRGYGPPLGHPQDVVYVDNSANDLYSGYRY